MHGFALLSLCMCVCVWVGVNLNVATVDGIDRANLNKKEATAVALCVGASNLASNFSTVCRDLKYS